MGNINVIDLGNYNTKILNNAGEKNTFKSVISKGFESYEDAFKYVLYDGEYTYFEKGEFNLEYTKTKKDYMQQILYALSSLNIKDNKLDTKLCLLLPLDQMKYKKVLIDDLKNKEFKFKAKHQKKADYEVKIDDVIVLAECMSSFFMLDDKDKGKSILLIDIGGRTLNIVSFIAGQPEIVKTIQLGMLNFYSKIKEKNSNLECRLEDVKRLIEEGKIKLSEKEYGKFLQEIINQVKIYTKIELYEKVIFTGGGSIELKNCIETALPKNCCVLENALTSNIEGALKASQIVWGEDNE